MISSLWSWLSRKKTTRLPAYSRFRSVPLDEIAPDLVVQEHSPAHAAGRSAIERTLLEPPRCPSEESPLFTTLIAADNAGIVTVTLPEGRGACVPVFSTPVRAADYVDVCLPKGPEVRFLVSSPVGLHKMFNDLGPARAGFMALDRCPRCTTFMTVQAISL